MSWNSTHQFVLISCTFEPSFNFLIQTVRWQKQTNWKILMNKYLFKIECIILFHHKLHQKFHYLMFIFLLFFCLKFIIVFPFLYKSKYLYYNNYSDIYLSFIICSVLISLCLYICPNKISYQEERRKMATERRKESNLYWIAKSSLKRIIHLIIFENETHFHGWGGGSEYTFWFIIQHFEYYSNLNAYKSLLRDQLLDGNKMILG